MGFRNTAPIFWPYTVVRLSFSVFGAIEDRLLKATLDTDEQLGRWLAASRDTTPSNAFQRHKRRIVRLLLQKPDSAPEAKTSNERSLSAEQIAFLDRWGAYQETQTALPFHQPEFAPQGHSCADQTERQRPLTPAQSEDPAVHPQNTATEKDTQKGPSATSVGVGESADDITTRGGLTDD